jgi:ankyrin repeat protein
MLRFQPQPTSFELLMQSAKTGNLDCLNMLLEQGVIDPAVDNNRALRWAASKGHLLVVERLLAIPAVEANVTALNNIALRWAYAGGHLDVVKRLLEVHSVRAAALASNNLSQDLRMQILHYDNLVRLSMGA